MQDADFDFEKERRWAEEGFASAQFNLAVIYEEGRGVPRDSKQAEFWYKKAAEQRHPEAQNNLAIMYRRKAAEELKNSAQKGNADAQYKLALQYSNGANKDYEQAAFWYEKAAKQGLANAASALGRLYRRGDGVTQDDEKALFWRRKAAEQGDASEVGSSRVDLQACKLEYSIVSPK